MIPLPPARRPQDRRSNSGRARLPWAGSLAPRRNRQHHVAGGRLARHNYQFEKRQRDLAKKQKKEEKRQRKLERPDEPEGDAPTGEAETDTPINGDPVV